MVSTTEITETPFGDDWTVERMVEKTDVQTYPNYTVAALLKNGTSWVKNVTMGSKKLAAYIANLSPDEIKNKQDLVLQHVQQEAIKNGLTELEAQKLLVETLHGNGLPLIEGLDPAATGQVDLLAPLAPVAGLFAGVGETLSSMLGTNIEKTGNTEEEIPGLPTPGTLNYAVTMALFKASESVNGFLNGLTGGSQIQQVNIPNNKIDQDDLQSSSSSNIFSTIGSFLPGSQNLQVSLDPSNSGSLTNVAVSPAIIGLGLIATGLLGGVAYASSSNRRSDLATSASSLAKGAVDAIRKNPIVQKIEDTVLGFTGKNPYATKKDTADPYVFYPDYDQGYNGQYSYQGYEDPRVENYERLVEYPDYEYVDPREQVRAPSQPHYQTYQPKSTAADGEVSESFTLADASQHKINQAIPDHVVFYEPDTKIEVVTYNEEHNPWEYLHNGQSTDHLYSRGFKR